MSICKKCGARIYYRQNKAGKNVAVDPETVDPSDCEDTHTLIREDGIIREASIASDDPESIHHDWYVLHSSTCFKPTGIYA